MTFAAAIRALRLSNGWLIALLLGLSLAGPAGAHPVPFSYLTLNFHDGGIDGTLTIHVSDAAHELGLADPRSLLDRGLLAAEAPALETLLEPRLGLAKTGPVRWTLVEPIASRDAVSLGFRIDQAPPGRLALEPRLFPYDASHQTFVDVYQEGALRQQFMFSGTTPEQTYYRGTTAGAFAVIRSFVPAGVHHIWIGADHLLFLFGLIVLGGGWRRLGMIVTAFTVGHSITLTLAALDIVDLPASFVEPAIALSIVVVGVDNLLRQRGEARDLRAPAAALFGLVHGFGFANVLKELGLPKEALGWSLLSFNIGVEIGQLAIVIVVALLLGILRRRSSTWLRTVESCGSALVVAGGTYWFVERTLF